MQSQIFMIDVNNMTIDLWKDLTLILSNVDPSIEYYKNMLDDYDKNILDIQTNIIKINF